MTGENKELMEKRTFVLSDSRSVNSLGFRVDLTGMDLSRFNGNPVMLYNHDSGKVIGRWDNVRKSDGQLLADAVFDLDDPLGSEVSRKVENGFLRGCSVGAHIREFAEEGEVMVASKSVLLEASIVAVPSDAGAVLLYDHFDRPLEWEKGDYVFLNYNKQKKEMDKQFEPTAKTVTLLGIEGTATVQALESAVVRLSDSLQAEQSKVVQLQQQLREYEKRRVASLVDQAIAAKKIGADERDTYVSLGEKDFAAVEKILSKLPGVEPVVGKLSVGAASKWDGKTWDELDRAGQLSALRNEEPERYKTLYALKFGV
jgi:HK97 family phage prohead protease